VNDVMMVSTTSASAAIASAEAVNIGSALGGLRGHVTNERRLTEAIRQIISIHISLLDTGIVGQQRRLQNQQRRPMYS
jgi:hypothetical protein